MKQEVLNLLNNLIIQITALTSSPQNQKCIQGLNETIHSLPDNIDIHVFSRIQHKLVLVREEHTSQDLSLYTTMWFPFENKMNDLSTKLSDTQIRVLKELEEASVKERKKPGASPIEGIDFETTEGNTAYMRQDQIIMPEGPTATVTCATEKVTGKEVDLKVTNTEGILHFKTSPCIPTDPNDANRFMAAKPGKENTEEEKETTEESANKLQP